MEYGSCSCQHLLASTIIWVLLREVLCLSHLIIQEMVWPWKCLPYPSVIIDIIKTGLRSTWQVRRGVAQTQNTQSNKKDLIDEAVCDWQVGHNQILDICMCLSLRSSLKKVYVQNTIYFFLDFFFHNIKNITLIILLHAQNAQPSVSFCYHDILCKTSDFKCMFQASSAIINSVHAGKMLTFYNWTFFLP